MIYMIFVGFVKKCSCLQVYVVVIENYSFPKLEEKIYSATYRITFLLDSTKLLFSSLPFLKLAS